MRISYKPYKDRLWDMWYNISLQKNIDYLKKHGKSPYEFRGRNVGIVTPYLDSGYWIGYQDWLRTAFKVKNINSDTNEFEFENEVDATMFLMRVK